MNRRDVAILICRSLALWNIVGFIEAFPSVIAVFYQSDAGSIPHLLGSVVAGECLRIVAVYLLWTRAGQIADRMLRGTTGGDDTKVNVVDVQQIVVAGIGVLVLSYSAPAVLAEFASVVVRWSEQRGADLSPFRQTSLIQELGMTAFGLWLFLGSRGLAAYWQRIRTVGLEKV